MAERRMFHMSVVESDSFLDLPIGAQALYFHIGMHADDDGFVNGPRQIMRKMGGCQEDLEALYEAGFLLDFDGIAVVKHWRMANSMQNDRVKPLRYPEIAKKIYVRENRSYSEKQERGSVSLPVFRRRYLESSRISAGFQKDSNRIPKGKEKKGKEPKGNEMKGKERNINESNAEESNPTPPGADGACDGLIYDSQKKKDSVVELSPRQVSELMEIMGSQEFSRYVLKLSDFIRRNDANVKDHYATILKWWREDGCENERMEVPL